MATKAEVYQVIFDWLKAESGLVVIKANQAAPRPARPYVSLNFLNPALRLGGQDQQEMNEATDEVTTSGMRSAVASINIFGENAIDTLARVRDSLDRPDVIERFSELDVAVIDDSAIRDLTALQETIYEERGQLDLTVGFVSESEVDVSTIEKVEIETEIGGQEQTISGPN
jgi:hypothetical protein